MVFHLAPPAVAGSGWTETVVHSFDGGDGGVQPSGTLVADGSGALYGTTSLGGSPACSGGCGTVFRLAPPVPGESTWTITILHRFSNLPGGGAHPYGGLTLGPAGVLYGSTTDGGPADGGIVFKLTPPAVAPGIWTEQVLHQFKNGRDGALPNSPLLLNADGVLYGTTFYGGDGTVPYSGNGVVFEIRP